MVLTLTVVAPPAEACVECAVALGLASFAVFTQIVAAVTAPRVVYTAPPYYEGLLGGGASTLGTVGMDTVISGAGGLVGAVIGSLLSAGKRTAA